MKRFNWKTYFHFSKKERSAAIVIAVIISTVTAASLYITKPAETPVTTSFAHILNDSLKKIESKSNNTSTIKNNSANSRTIDAANLFYFDPNTLNKEGWQKTGLPEKNIQTILNYLSKGGHFRKPEDIYKVYGISKENAALLLPFIQIADTKEKFIYTNNTNVKNATIYTHRDIQPVNINTATEEQWKALPGIGDVLSKRIVKYRNAKGGFHSIDDIKKTYGLSDSTFKLIQPYLLYTENNTPKKDTASPSGNLSKTIANEKININTATEQEMKNARFLSISVIKAIIIYRKEHKGFKSVSELKNIPFISDEMYKKIAPGLIVE